VSNRTYSFDDLEFPDEEVLEAVLSQFYQAHHPRRARRDRCCRWRCSDADIRAEVSVRAERFAR